MPLEIHQEQCATALKLVHAGRAQGIVFLTITNNAPIVEWTADWVKQVGHQRLNGKS
jgi:hypothetical protein